MREMKSAKIGVRIIASLLVVAAFVSMVIAQPIGINVYSTTGIEDENGVPLLGDGSSSSDLVQLINSSSDGTINSPDGNGNPTGDDSIICRIRIGEYYPPDEGRFCHFGVTVEKDTTIYCRAWNDATVTTATHYGDSITISVTEAGDYDFGTWSTDTEKTTPSPTASPSSSPTPTPTSSPTASPSPALTETPISSTCEQTPSPTPSLSPSPSPTRTPAASPGPISSPTLTTPAKPTPSSQTPAPAATSTPTPAVTPMDAKVLISSLAISIVIALRKRKR